MFRLLTFIVGVFLLWLGVTLFILWAHENVIEPWIDRTVGPRIDTALEWWGDKTAPLVERVLSWRWWG